MALTLSPHYPPLLIQHGQYPVTSKQVERLVEFGRERRALAERQTEARLHEEVVDGHQVARRPPRHVLGDLVRQDEDEVLAAHALDALAVWVREGVRVRRLHARPQLANDRVVGGAQSVVDEAAVERAEVHVRLTEQVLGRRHLHRAAVAVRPAHEQRRLDRHERVREVDGEPTALRDVERSRRDVSLLEEQQTRRVQDGTLLNKAATRARASDGK